MSKSQNLKLLIITQALDENNPILGFFHRWVEEFARRCDKVSVICLEEGEYNLPENVEVFSLGKEQYLYHSRVIRRLVSLYRFYKYVFQLRRRYDIVFIHMNQEYALLGGMFWRLMGKKVFLWRNHPAGDWQTGLACRLSNKIFYTSPKAYVAKFRNASRQPAGIDISRFSPAPLPVESNKILMFGRIAPVKRIELFLTGLGKLKTKRTSFKADIVGDALPKDAEYYESLKDKIQKLKLSRIVRMLPAVPPEESPELLRQYKLFVNLTPDGSLDKTTFEALASGLKVVTSNSFFKGVLPEGWVVDDPEDADHLAHVMKFTLNDSHSRNTEAQNRIAVFLEEHNLTSLISKLIEEFE